MPYFIVSISFILLLSAGCAHKEIVSQSGTGAASTSTDAPSSEDQAIKKLPANTQGDLGTGVEGIGSIDVVVNPQVEKWIQYFQGRGRGYFERYLERSTRYVPMMKKVLKENGVPEDLIYIAMIESGFTGKIKSRARAVGFWQFISGTGKHYGLVVNKYMDERYDPVRSTEAASNYFKGLYNLFANWYLAIASYNVGENRIKSMVMKNYTRDFWELARRKQLPAETMDYIPKFIAAGLIAREPEKYGFTGLNYEPEMVFDTVSSKDPVDLKVLAKAMKIDYDELKDLNPALKTQYIPVTGDTATIRVPQGTGEAAKLALSEAVVKNKKQFAQTDAPSNILRRYRVRRGETLEIIAERFDVSVEDILKHNHIRHGRVRTGQTIRIPISAANEPKERKAVSQSSRPPRLPAKQTVYVVKRGDTLIRIARHHNVTVEILKKTNRLPASEKVVLGQKLVIPRSPGRDS